MGRQAGQKVTPRTWKVTGYGHQITIETPDEIDVLEIKFDGGLKRARVTFSSAIDSAEWNNAKVEHDPTIQP